MTVSRREFIRDTAAVAGGIAVAPLLVAESDAATHDLPHRTLGRTKEKVSLLGFGVAPLGSDNTTPQEAERIVNAAIDAGITYLDVSPDYGDIHSKYGNAEMKLKGVLKARRHEVFLVTKVNPDRQDREGVIRQVHESLERMGTDHADAVHIHNLGDFDMNRLFQPDGALAGLKEARRQGLLRFI